MVVMMIQYNSKINTVTNELMRREMDELMRAYDAKLDLVANELLRRK
jgi:hypothetical protein